MNYSFHHHAEKELEEIEKYYDDIRDELGDRFRDEIQLTISRILKRPHMLGSHCHQYNSTVSIEFLSLWFGLPREARRNPNLSGDASSS